MRAILLLGAAIALSACAVGSERVAESCASTFGRDLTAHADCAERSANTPALLMPDMGIAAPFGRQYAQYARLAASRVASGEGTTSQAWMFLAQAQQGLGQQGNARLDAWKANAVPAFAGAANYIQTQQLLNTPRAPVVTNCSRFGNMVNCTSN